MAAAGHSQFTLKVADQDCARVDPRLVPQGQGKCEYDVYGASTAGAVSLTRILDDKNTSDLISGRLAPEQALSPSQVTYLREVSGVWPLPKDIRPLGPMQVRTYRAKGQSYDIDISQLPDGVQYAEISRKVPVRDATRAMAVLKAHLSGAGIET